MSDFEMPALSPISNVGFRYSRSFLLYRMDIESEFLVFFGIKSIDRFLEFKVVTIGDKL